MGDVPDVAIELGRGLSGVYARHACKELPLTYFLPAHFAGAFANVGRYRDRLAMTLPWIKHLFNSQQPDNHAEDAPVHRLRQQILAEGIPDEEQHDAGVSNRSIAWKVLLGVYDLEAEDYLHYVSLGASAAHDKVALDT